MSNLEKVALSNQLEWPVLWEADNMENAKICIISNFVPLSSGLFFNFYRKQGRRRCKESLKKVIANTFITKIA